MIKITILNYYSKSFEQKSSIDAETSEEKWEVRQEAAVKQWKIVVAWTRTTAVEVLTRCTDLVHILKMSGMRGRRGKSKALQEWSPHLLTDGGRYRGKGSLILYQTC